MQFYSLGSSKMVPLPSSRCLAEGNRIWPLFHGLLIHNWVFKASCAFGMCHILLVTHFHPFSAILSPLSWGYGLSTHYTDSMPICTVDDTISDVLLNPKYASHVYKVTVAVDNLENIMWICDLMPENHSRCNDLGCKRPQKC